MRITFIIPYYNEPVWMLSACLESIIQLPLESHEREIIVVDDGSMKSPMDDIRKINDGIIYIRQENGGPGAARNKGMEMATGDYIQFIDSDDTLLEQYNEICKIIRRDNPDIVLFQAIKTPKYHIDKSGEDYMLTHNIRGAACTLAFRREILDGLRYDTELINEDELFNAQLILKAKRIIDVGCQAYSYRIRQESRSHDKNHAKLKRRLDDAAIIINRLNDISNSLSGNKKLALKRRVNQLCMDYIYNICIQTKSISELGKRCTKLKEKGLYPLPTKKYTLKYLIFASLTHIISPFLTEKTHTQ